MDEHATRVGQIRDGSGHPDEAVPDGELSGQRSATEIDAIDLPPDPEWVRRLRADGFGVRVGTVGPPGLPYEPEIDFSVPEPRERAVWKQVVAAARKLFGSR